MIRGDSVLLIGILGNLGALLLEAGRAEDALAEIEKALVAVRAGPAGMQRVLGVVRSVGN